MIYIITALKSEAEPVISFYKLKIEKNNGSFLIYGNDFLKLAVTGTGGVNSAVGTTYLLTKYGVSKSDSLINIGIAGCNRQNTLKYPKGKLFAINSLTGKSTGRKFYPDMLIMTSLPEASLITVDEIWQKQSGGVIQNENNTPELVDMEGAYIYQSALFFLFSHNIFIFKIISDFGDCEVVTKEVVSKLVSDNMELLSDTIYKIENFSKSLKAENTLSDSDVKFIEFISQKLMLTSFRKTQLKKLCEYYAKRERENSKGSNDDIIEKKIRKITDEIPEIKEKRESSIIYEKIRKSLA